MSTGYSINGQNAGDFLSINKSLALTIGNTGLSTTMLIYDCNEPLNGYSITTSNGVFTINDASPSAPFTNVGIGTTAPRSTATLQVQGTLLTSNIGTYNTNNTLYFNNSSIANVNNIIATSLQVNGSITATSNIANYNRVSLNNGVNANYYIGMYNTTAGSLAPLTDSQLYWNPSTNIINLAGLVGTGQIITSNITTTGPALKITQQGNTQPVAHFIAGTTNAMYIQSNAFIGIGTTKPLTILSINSTTSARDPIVSINNTIGGVNATATLEFNTYPNQGTSNTDPPAAHIKCIDDGFYAAHLAFYTKQTGAPKNSLNERIRITSIGYVGINKSVPTSILDLGGTSQTSTPAQTIQCASGDLTLHSGLNALHLSVANVVRVRVTATSLSPSTNNNMSLGDSTNKWTTVYATTPLISASDAREKTNIQSTNLGLDFINKLNPVSYKWIVGHNDTDDSGNIISSPGQRTFYGLIAQEVKQTLDEINAGDFAGWILSDVNDPNSSQGLRYTEFISPMVKAIQDLSSLVTQLTARVAELETKIN